MVSKHILGIVLVVLVALFLTACTTSIADVKSQDKINTKVTVSGTVEGSIKLGELSGYTLTDDSGSIFISSNNLPNDGVKKTVSGTLEKNLLGFYIETK
jgi:hypothetical protein